MVARDDASLICQVKRLKNQGNYVIPIYLLTSANTYSRRPYEENFDIFNDTWFHPDPFRSNSRRGEAASL